MGVDGTDSSAYGAKKITSSVARPELEPDVTRQDELQGTHKYWSDDHEYPTFEGWVPEDLLQTASVAEIKKYLGENR